ncbi:hypothetical protein Klosneuvirus_9_15 [Klosneuvirus KNV1]|uniref:Uncharacterized protein n=1 Tax=Klosneuvirus KNV1 TaxID=1977640 RepID=A0A1V0SLM2_9VIRU|nr:hypothetical protein Klosneuvirus_9_15 [Klosneuvirus KNV1]
MTDLLTKFVTKAINKFGDKFDYSRVVYVNNRTFIIIICKLHGEFTQTPELHIRCIYACPKCKPKIIGKKMNTEEFIGKANLIHNKEYLYDLVEYINTSTKVIITCKIHGNFQMAPNDHLSQKQGCYKCNKLRAAQIMILGTDKFIERSKEIFGDKFNYDLVNYINNQTKVILICKTHGKFETIPANHLKRGDGCTKCYNNYSKKQIEWLNLIMQEENIHIQHAENGGEYMIPNTNYKVDGFCKETNTIYEFMGDYFHGNPALYNPMKPNPTNKKLFGELYLNTFKKELLIMNLDYNYVSIWETEYDKIVKNKKLIKKQ